MNLGTENKDLNAEVYGNQDDWAPVHSDVSYRPSTGGTPSSLLRNTLENL